LQVKCCLDKVSLPLPAAGSAAERTDTSRKKLSAIDVRKKACYLILHVKLPQSRMSNDYIRDASQKRKRKHGHQKPELPSSIKHGLELRGPQGGLLRQGRQGCT
jgi:hypothetical protein